MKSKFARLFTVCVLAIVPIFALQGEKANATEFDSLCAGDGTAVVEFLYGLHSGTTTTIFTNGQPSVTNPGSAIGFQILSTNPSRYNFEWVVSTDAEQQNVIDSTRLAGFTFHPEGSNQEGFGRWEWNGGFAQRNFDTDYYFSVNLYLPDGTQFACSPVLLMPGISQADATAINNSGGMSSWPAYLGSNPYAPGGLFDSTPAAPQTDEVTLDPNQVIDVPAEFQNFAEIMNVEYSTDGGETWAAAPLESVNATSNAPVSYQSSVPMISTALYSPSNQASFHAAVAQSKLNATFGISAQSNGSPLAVGASYEISLRGVNQDANGANLYGAKSADICYQMGDASGSLCAANAAAEPASGEEKSALAATGLEGESSNGFLIGFASFGSVLLGATILLLMRKENTFPRKK